MSETLLSLMQEAHRGERSIWEPVFLGLRDAMVASATRDCPYYRDVARSAETFEELPILTKSIVRERADDLVAERVAPERRVEKTTGGSTGEPMRFMKDLWAGPIEVAACLFLKLLHRIPLDATRVLVTMHSEVSDHRFDAASRVAGPMGKSLTMPIGSMSAESLRDGATSWSKLGPYWLYSTASSLDDLATAMLERHIEIPSPPVAVVTTGDTMTAGGLEAMTRAFGSPVHSWYGSNEFGGYVAGSVPDAPLGTYLWNPWLAYAEIIDDQGRPAPPGTAGRLVVTDLHNHVMPLIRYDTGDAASFEGGTVNAFPVLGNLTGRSATERIRLPSGRVITTSTASAAFEDIRLVNAIRGWQCVQTSENAIELHVVWSGGEAPPGVEDLLCRLFRHTTDEETEISVRSVEHLARLPSGKRWLVRSQA